MRVASRSMTVRFRAAASWSGESAAQCSHAAARAVARAASMAVSTEAVSAARVVTNLDTVGSDGTRPNIAVCSRRVATSASQSPCSDMPCSYTNVTARG
jgi:hypothetical protein